MIPPAGLRAAPDRGRLLGVRFHSATSSPPAASSTPGDREDHHRGQLLREQQAHLPLPRGRGRAPPGAGAAGQRPPLRGRRPHPRREGARRPLGERRVRGRQERAGLRRGPDPVARGDAHEPRSSIEHTRTEHVPIGSTVTVDSGDGGETFTIVGSAEARPAEGRISNESPVGRALLGEARATRSSSRLPNGDFRYTIIRSASARPGRPGGRPEPPPARPPERRTQDVLGGRAGGDRQGPQVVNDSKTPSGTVHVGSLRGPVILDAITRALRDRGLPTTLLYGVDDMDPMDAQALLTPDAVEHEMGRPAGARARPGGRLPRLATRGTTPRFIDMFAGLGIHPDRYYWMSDIYPTGAVDPFIRDRPGPGRSVRDVYRRVANVQHPGLAPGQRRLPDLRQGRHDDRVGLGRRARPASAAPTSSPGPRLRPRPAGSPRSAAGQAPLEPGVGRPVEPLGVTIEPCGKDLATAGGSRDRSDAIAREVFDREPPLNVPYEFLNIGGRKMSTSKGRGRRRPHGSAEVAAAGAAALPLPPRLARTTRSISTRRADADPAPLRRVRPAGRRHRRPRGAGRAAAGPRPHLRLRRSLDPDADPDGRGGAYRPRLRPPGAPRPDPRRRPRRPRRDREGRPARPRRGGGHPRGAARGRAGLARALRAGKRPSRVRRDALPAEATRPAASSASSWAASPCAAEREGPASARPGRTARLPVAAGRPPCRRGAPSAPSTLRSWAGPTVRGRAGSWRPAGALRDRPPARGCRLGAVTRERTGGRPR